MAQRPMQRTRRRQNSFTYISPCVKYTIFFSNFLFWIIGGFMAGLGVYAFVDEWQMMGTVEVESAFDVLLDISIILMVIGGVIFIISFAGCVGALRENTCLLKFYSLSLIIFFFGELTIAALGFIYPHKVTEILEGTFSETMIKEYREDLNLQNFVDTIQHQFECCGLTTKGYLDWSDNIYFNCTPENPSRERCGVPWSCCVNPEDVTSGLINIMCGYDVQNLPLSDAAKKSHTQGCIPTLRNWSEQNLYIIGGIAVGIAVFQILVIYFAKTFLSQIKMQKSLWR